MSDSKNHDKEKEQRQSESVEEESNETRELTEEEQAELLKKFDTESNTRNVRGKTAAIVFVLLLSFSLFQLYTGIFGQYTAYIQRTVHLGFALTLIFYYFQHEKLHHEIRFRGMILS